MPRAITKSEIQQAVTILKQGGVIVHATETCYGFACDAFNKKALDRLYKLKQMSKSKPVSILVHSLSAAQKYGFFNTRAKKLARKFWPGPLTIIVKRKKTLPGFLNPGAKTVGFRVPGHTISRTLSKLLDRPITTTSANISKESSVYSIPELKKQFHNSKTQPNLILDSGRIPRRPASTAVDSSTSGGDIRLIREGSIRFRRILRSMT